MSNKSHSNLVCFRHPDYDGENRPHLACKTCCSIFVSALKDRVQSGKMGEVDTQQWLEEKREQAMRASRGQAPKVDAKFGFNPASI